MENETTELIDQYLLDQLDAPARQVVENRIQTDARFAEEVAVQRAIVRQARWLGREGLRQQLKTIAAANAQTPESVGATPVIPLHSARSIWPYLAIAASLLLIMGIWFWDTQSTGSGHGGTSTESSVAVTIPLIQSGSVPAMGFATRSDTTEITVLVYPGPTSGQYRFDDTLRLYGPFDPAKLSVTYLPDSAVYRLHVGSNVFPLERYKARQPLAR